MSEILPERRSLFEQHTQTVLTLVVVGLLAWVALTTHNLDVKAAVMSEQITNLEITAAGPQERVNDLTRRIERIEEVILAE